MPVGLQITEQLSELPALVCTQRATRRSFNPEPDVISFHHATNTRKRQTVITKRVSMARGHGIDGVRRNGHNLISAIGGRAFNDRRKPRQPFAPQVFPLPAWG